MLEAGVVGSLDYKIVTAERSDDLYQWLKQNRYSYSGDEATLGIYIDKKWVFTVMRIDPKQMKRAGAWRQGLRRQILAAYARMGRNPQLAENRRRGLDAGRKDTFFGRSSGIQTTSGTSFGGIGGGFSGLDADPDFGGMFAGGACSWPGIADAQQPKS